jgi:hypothetical protein
VRGRRWVLTSVVLVTAMLTVPVPVGATARALPSSGRSPAFPPGTWEGNGRLTGGFSAGGGQVTLNGPAPFTFRLTVAKGVTTGGSFSLGPFDETVSVAGGGGTETASSDGTLGGTADRVTLTGTANVSGTITLSSGVSSPVDVTGVPFSGAYFVPAGVACGEVWGDLTSGSLGATTGAGVTGPFIARRVGNGHQQALGGEDNGRSEVVLTAARREPSSGALPRVTRQQQGASAIDTEAFDLISALDLLAGASPPKVDAVLGLVPRLNQFLHDTANPKLCPGDTAGQKGKKLTAQVAAHLAKLLSKLLAYGPGYNASQLQALVTLAVKYGLVGSSAPNANVAGTLLRDIRTAVSAKLDLAVNNHDESACGPLAFIAQGLKFGDLARRADKC